MKEKKFATLEELKTQAIKDEACRVGLEWLDEQETIEQVIKDIQTDWRTWCLLQGYFQFEKNCKWEELDRNNWAFLLSEQPQFSGHCQWDKLMGFNWSWLLSEQPQFSNFCLWEKLNGFDWANLLRKQPQFSNRCDWEKLLRFKPHLINFINKAKLNGDKNE